MRIEKTELEFDEIYKGKVKPIATGGHIPFFKKFIGRIVHVIMPKQEKGFWLLKDKDLKVLQKEVEEIKFSEPYSKQKKENLKDSLNEISRHSVEFNFNDLINVTDVLSNQEIGKESKEVIDQIKKTYSI